jgi:hypothetical protein
VIAIFVMDIHNEFIAQKKDLVFYAGKPILNRLHSFYDINDNPWNFADVIGLSFKIWQEREGGLLMIDWDDSNLSISGNDIILNSQAVVTNIERGKYYYEMEYFVVGGYPILIAFGEAKFI